jgi:broad specificity phosphatase PhoE
LTSVFYIVHSTSEDNEKGVVSGQKDTPLSSTGMAQTRDLATRPEIVGLRGLQPLILTSPLCRAMDTASGLFPGFPLKAEPRLMEIDYGTLTGTPGHVIKNLRHSKVTEPFPDGESYHDVEKRIRTLLQDYPHTPALVLVSHQAPQLALEVILNRKTWEQALNEDWRTSGAWQPLWTYPAGQLPQSVHC